MKMKHYIEARKSRIYKIPSSYTIEVAKKRKTKKLRRLKKINQLRT
jgi:hypothetical protein